MVEEDNGHFGGGVPQKKPPLSNRLKEKLGRESQEPSFAAAAPPPRRGEMGGYNRESTEELKKPSYGASAARKPAGGIPPRRTNNNPPRRGGFGASEDPPELAAPVGTGSSSYAMNLPPEAFAQNTSTGPMIECRQCGRSFNEEAIEKHERICNKVFQQKRKQFNMADRRVIDSEHKQIQQYSKVEERKKGGRGAASARKGAAPAKSAKWKA